MTSDIQFRYSRTVIQHYLKNFGDEAKMAEYRAIIPDTAFISNFTMLVGNKEYVAEVKESKEASKEFEDLVSQGSGVGLVEQNTRNKNLFTIKTNVEPGEKVLFKLTYDELLERTLGKYEQVINVNPDQIVDDFNINFYIRESLPIVDLKLLERKDSNEINVINAKPSSLAVIENNVDNNPSNADISVKIPKSHQLKNKEPKEFVLQYDVDRKNQDNELQVVDGYFVHYFTPQNLPVRPKQIIFVLDTSGSMSGEKIVQLKDAMFTIIDELSGEDYFYIVEFDSTIKEWPENHKSVRATDDNKKKGIARVFGMRADGVTGANEGLLAALEHGQKGLDRGELKNKQTMIIFLSDGQPTSTTSTKLLRNVRVKNKKTQFPIYSLAFGRGADFDLMVELSEESEAFPRQIYEDSDAALQLEGFFKLISNPLLSKVEINYIDDTVEDVSVTKTKTFFKGSEFIVTGRVKPGTSVIRCGWKGTGATPYQQDLSFCLLPPFIGSCINIPPPPPPRTQSQNFVKNLHAFLNIKQLLKKDDSTSRGKALRLALDSNFVTELTSLIVHKKGEKDKVYFKYDTQSLIPQRPAQVFGGFGSASSAAATSGGGFFAAQPYLNKGPAPAYPAYGGGFGGGGGGQSSSSSPTTTTPRPRPTNVENSSS